MNKMNKIEQHIARQTEVMESWTSAAPEIKARILSQSKQIKALEVAHSKALQTIAAMQKRIAALENPQHRGTMQKLKEMMK